jgi:hypothetical protein
MYHFQGLIVGSSEIINSHCMENILKKGHSSIISQLHSIHVVETPSMHLDLQAILSKHKGFFSTPQGLPPYRGVHDHSIPLVIGNIPPNILPYHHPFSQKNAIEKIVRELLQDGVMHPSTIPYSSLMVMVLKQEATWCMCPKFPSLNQLTIKEMFPILLIDYLLDELSGAQYFTILDLHSGYHQIRMQDADIPKNSFQTHDSHHEFLVMPFGLCNVPSTFQSLMNHVFHLFRRHFVLSFFDDIII